MKSISAVLVGLGMLLAIAMPVSAAYDKDDIGELVEKFKKGEGFSEAVAIPSEQKQYLRFYLYAIDIRAQLCFYNYTLVPCEKLKKAYPLIAPFITWVK